MKAFGHRKCKSPGQESSTSILTSSVSGDKPISNSSPSSHSVTRRHLFPSKLLGSLSPSSHSRQLHHTQTAFPGEEASQTTATATSEASHKSKSSGFKWFLDRRRSTPPVGSGKGASSQEVATHSMIEHSSSIKTPTLWEDPIPPPTTTEEELENLVEREVQSQHAKQAGAASSSSSFMSLFRTTFSRNSLSPPIRLQSPDSVATVASVSSGMGGPSPVSRENSPASAALGSGKDKVTREQLLNQHHTRSHAHQIGGFVSVCAPITSSPDSGLEDGGGLGRRSTGGGLPLDLPRVSAHTEEIIVECEYSEPRTSQPRESAPTAQTQVSMCESVASSSSELQQWPPGVRPKVVGTELGSPTSLASCSSAWYAVPCGAVRGSGPEGATQHVTFHKIYNFADREEVTPTNPPSMLTDNSRAVVQTLSSLSIGTPKSSSTQPGLTSPTPRCDQPTSSSRSSSSSDGNVPFQPISVAAATCVLSESQTSAPAPQPETSGASPELRFTEQTSSSSVGQCSGHRFTSPQGGLTVLRHHPASPFAPIPRRATPPSPVTSHPPTVEESWSVKVDRCLQQQQQEEEHETSCDVDAELETDCVQSSSRMLVPQDPPPPPQDLLQTRTVSNLSRYKSNSMDQLQRCAVNEVSSMQKDTCEDGSSGKVVGGGRHRLAGSTGQEGDCKDSPEESSDSPPSCQPAPPRLSMEEDAPSSGTTDSWSTTDSYEEPWDVRHRRMINELTSARLLDPTSLRSLVITTRPSTETPKPSTGTSSGSATCSTWSSTTQPILTDRSRPLQMCGLDESANDNVHNNYLHQSQHLSSMEYPSAGLYPFTSSRVTDFVFVSPRGGRCPAAVDTSLPLEEQSWFHGDLSRHRAEQVLQYMPLGAFLVRRSESNPAAFSLSIRHQQGYLHMMISNMSMDKSPQYVLGQHSQPFPSVSVMLRHYQHHILPIRGADAITLGEPVAAILPTQTHPRKHGQL